MWPWKLEIELLLGIHVSPSESMRKVIDPPSLAAPSPACAPAPALPAHPAVRRRVAAMPAAVRSLGDRSPVRDPVKWFNMCLSPRSGANAPTSFAGNSTNLLGFDVGRMPCPRAGTTLGRAPATSPRAVLDG